LEKFSDRFGESKDSTRTNFSSRILIWKKYFGSIEVIVALNCFTISSDTGITVDIVYFRTFTKSWTLVTYVPDKVKVKEKMTYASSKSSLKDKLGYNFFEQEIHITSKNDLSFDFVTNSAKPVDGRSHAEKQKETLLNHEEKERAEQIQQMSNKTIGPSGGIGGFHSVVIPLSTNAKEELESLKTSQNNFIQLMINDTRDQIEAKNPQNILVSAIKSNLVQNEPRFYVFKSSGEPSPKYSFIYCCPEKSPTKLRMVYSTSKNGVTDQLSSLGFNITSHSEVTDTNANVDFLEANDKVRSRASMPPGKISSGATLQQTSKSFIENGSTKSKSSPKITGAHPLSQLMSQNSSLEGSTTKKKIVIPPSSAW